MNISALLCDAEERADDAGTSVSFSVGRIAVHAPISSKMSISLLLSGPEICEDEAVGTLSGTQDLKRTSSTAPSAAKFSSQRQSQRRRKPRNRARSSVREVERRGGPHRQRSSLAEGSLSGLRKKLLELQEQHHRRLTLRVTVRQGIPTDAFGLMTTYLRVLQNDISGACALKPGQRNYLFSRVHPSMKQLAPGTDTGAGTPDFVVREWDVYRQAFEYRTCVVTSTRALTILEARDDEDEDEDEDEVEDEENQGESQDVARVRQICGRGRGCVLETMLEMAGQPTDATIAAMARLASSDEQLEAWRAVPRVAWQVRKLVYFDANAMVVHEEVTFQSCSTAAAAAAAALWG